MTDEKKEIYCNKDYDKYVTMSVSNCLPNSMAELLKIVCREMSQVQEADSSD